MVCDDDWKNLWDIKSILRVFELVSGLTTNFWKSCLFGVGVEDSFLDATAYFSACNSSRVPFKFLGLYFGGNHRRINFWKPVVDRFRVKLSTWKGKLLSIGV